MNPDTPSIARASTAWVQRVVEAGRGTIALAAVRTVWRAGRNSLFELACADESHGWMRVACVGMRSQLNARPRYPGT